MKIAILISTLALSACATQQPWEDQVPLVSQLSRLSSQSADDAEVKPQPAISQIDQPEITIAPAPPPVGRVTFTPKVPIRPTAQGFDLVDGAVVCRSYDLANFLAGEINKARHARISLSPELRRQAELINGYDYGAEPKLSDYGCVLVPVGTPLTVEPGNYVPVVSGHLANGHSFRGVTLPSMIDR
jgi:hypothetical protein